MENPQTLYSEEQIVNMIKDMGVEPRVISMTRKKNENEILGPKQTFNKLSKDEKAKIEEEEDILKFRIVVNDGKISSLKTLLDLKNIFTTQLPNMPKDYICKLVFNRMHRSVVCFKKGIVIGGITFRPFIYEGYIEITFCAITNSQQVNGYGTRLMNHLKHYCQQHQLYRFLTFADNNAIGYFRKLGFSKTLTLDSKRYETHIKHYDQSTLMECAIRPKVDYLDLPAIYRLQKKSIFDKLKDTSKSHIIYPGIPLFKKGQRINKIEDIPGIVEAGWKRKRTEKQVKDQTDKIFKPVLEAVLNHKSAWPFREPVDANAVPDYYTVIQDPIDLQTVEQRMKKNFYRTEEIFLADMTRMFENCKTYNAPDTEYYECAEELQKFFISELFARKKAAGNIFST